ncbi:helix-turn-helix transcriptional regulator [Nitriliruptor alkaliphilus]|uniref:helix-turn-helix transcriptional regulator n=1 Tax=Nitriliruptor alkaliphilus TaxID=427918 RepID=UPI002480757D|nr:LuxR C-terminal-related transcriptional regulator [Nitriliruptor alkaliphilus]
MDGRAREQAVRRVAELAGRGDDLVTFWQGCTEVLARVVPHYLGPCWYTLDPASLLVTSHHQDGLPEIPREWLAQEYYADDVNKLADVASSTRGVATLHEATDGDPTSSARWHQNMAYGGDQELIAGLRTSSGEVWGALGLYREPGQPVFDDEDLELVRAVAPSLAEGARRGLLIGEATEPEGPDAPGLVVLGADWELESMTPGVERWLAELPDGDVDRGLLPSAVYSVAGRAMRSDGDGPREVAVARVRSRAGRWVVLHGAALVGEGARRAAVIVEPAHPARISPLLMAAYRLTERERDVTRLVLQGRATAEIATELFISPHTVQEHLKHIFEKTGVHTRRDLVGTVFFAHYEPRVRDNEARAVREAPLRGGPFPPA